ncbi:MAG: L,D-transpeptidase [Actinomycetota bacterium]|nr:L,D-transpeptidase [Actinomycetota bacterium]
MKQRTGLCRSARLRSAVGALAFVMAVCAWLVAAPGVARAADRHLEIDISEQVLIEVVGGEVVAAMPVSTGSGEDYWFDGGWWDGETPRGWFEIYAKDPGWAKGGLGWLYNAMYFDGGFAIHGSTSVPDYPASHGCVRVTLADADALFERIPVGTPVFVHD